MEEAGGSGRKNRLSHRLALYPGLNDTTVLGNEGGQADPVPHSILDSPAYRPPFPGPPHRAVGLLTVWPLPHLGLEFLPDPQILVALHCDLQGRKRVCPALADQLRAVAVIEPQQHRVLLFPWGIALVCVLGPLSGWTSLLESATRPVLTNWNVGQAMAMGLKSESSTSERRKRRVPGRVLELKNGDHDGVVGPTPGFCIYPG